MDIRNAFTAEDQRYMVELRRRIHRRPELGFDLPETVALVKQELEKLGISYTEEYGKCSVVATLGAGARTVALRGDMDALPMEELTELPFKSQIPGVMHSCGHDAHTAILLGAAKVLKRLEDQLPCRVKLLFQPSEEGTVSGAEMMARAGAVEDVDEVLALHQDIGVPVGKLGLYSGDYMAACHPYKITFHGKAAHATQPQKGHDALAMAVKAYNDIYLMKCREISPFEQNVLSISCLHAGTAHNVIPDTAVMEVSFRFFSMELHDRVDARIRQICENAAAELGGTVEFEGSISAPPVYNDPALAGRMKAAGEKVVGVGNVIPVPPRMGSDDYSHFIQGRPGVLFRLGNGNPEKGCTYPSHNSRFMLDEDILAIGCMAFCQYVLDQKTAP